VHFAARIGVHRHQVVEVAFGQRLQYLCMQPFPRALSERELEADSTQLRDVGSCVSSTGVTP